MATPTSNIKSRSKKIRFLFSIYASFCLSIFYVAFKLDILVRFKNLTKLLKKVQYYLILCLLSQNVFCSLKYALIYI